MIGFLAAIGTTLTHPIVSNYVLVTFKSIVHLCLILLLGYWAFFSLTFVSLLHSDCCSLSSSSSRRVFSMAHNSKLYKCNKDGTFKNTGIHLKICNSNFLIDWSKQGAYTLFQLWNSQLLWTMPSLFFQCCCIQN